MPMTGHNARAISRDMVRTCACVWSSTWSLLHSLSFASLLLRLLLLLLSILVLPPILSRTSSNAQRLTISTSHHAPSTVHDTFAWADPYISRLQTYLGPKAFSKGFATPWSFRSTFTGAACAEIAALSLQTAAKKRGLTSFQVHLSRACDVSPLCRRLLLCQSFAKQCVFGSIEDWMSSGSEVLPSHLRHVADAPLINFRRLGTCHRHGGECQINPPLPHHRCLVIEVSGPPCPPWSRFGKKRGVDDPRFVPHQIWVAAMLQQKPDVIVFENVDAYPLHILNESFTSELWDVQACRLDPTDFGVPMARPRIYAVIINRSRARWTTQLPLHELLSVMTATPTLSIQEYFAIGSQPSRSLTVGEVHRREDCKSEFWWCVLLLLCSLTCDVWIWGEKKRERVVCARER